MPRVPERTIKDDRGQTLPMTRWMYRGQYPWPWHEVFPQTPSSWRRFQLLGYYVCIPFAAVMLATSFAPPGPIRDLADIVTDAFLLVMVPLTAIYIYLHFRVFRPWLKRYKQATGRCQACDYDLTNLAPEADGCTVCPECSAAWSL